MKIHDILRDAYKAGLPVLFWGPPGVGKTEAITAFARKNGIPLYTILPFIRDRTDYAGLPTFNETRDAVIFAPPEWPKRLVEEAQRTGRRPIVFINGLNTVPPSDQPPLKALALSKKVGDFQLPPDTVVFAAANPPELAAAGWDLAPSLANCFVHLQWPLDAREWADNFPTYWGSPPQLPDVPEEVWAIARALIAAFIRVRPHLLLQVPKDVEARSQPWPSPRSWDMASRCLAAVLDRNGKVTEGAQYVIGAVGEGPGTEFISWAKTLDLPDPKEVLANPDKFQLPNRGDAAYAVLAAVAALACSSGDKQLWQKAWRVLGKAHDAGAPDIAATAARQLAQSRRPDWETPPEASKFEELFREIYTEGQ